MVRPSARLPRLGLLSLVLILLPSLFLWRLWAPNPADRQVFASGDFVEQFYPLRHFVADELKSGRLPLWNPYIYGGTPALADPQWATLYPLAWLSLLVPPWPPLPFPVLEAEAALHLGLAGLFTYLFARRHMPALPATLAAIVYAFGGYLTSYPPLQLAVLETATWLPAVFWGVDGLVASTAGPLSVVLAAALLALAFLAGHPQTFLLILYAALGYFAFRAWRRMTLPHAATRLLAWLLAAAGLTAAQWLPLIELTRLGPRIVLPYAEAAVGFAWSDLAHIVLPGAFGPWSPLYVGGAPLLLAGAAVCYGRAEQRFWAFLAIAGLLLSLGGNGGLYWLAYHAAPGFALFRHQERAAILWSFALAVLAGYGLALLQHGAEIAPRPAPAEGERGRHGDIPRVRGTGRREESGEKRGESLTALLSFLPLCLRASVVRLGLTLRVLRRGAVSGHAEHAEPSSSPRNWGVLGLPSLWLAALALWFLVAWTRDGQPAEAASALWMSQAAYSAVILGIAWLLIRRTARPGWFPIVALVVLAWLDLFSMDGHGLTQPAPPGGSFTSNEILWTIQGDPDQSFRVSSEGLLPPGGGNGAAIWRIRDVVGNSPLHLAAYDRLIEKVPELLWWRLLAVRYVVTRRELTHGALTEQAKAGDVRLYRFADGLPLAWVVPALHPTGDDNAAEATLSDPRFDPLSYVVSQDPALRSLPPHMNVGAKPQRERGSGGEVSLSAVTPAHLRATVNTPQAGVLVISSAFAPGWRAWINGRLSGVSTVDGFLQGVAVPAGSSTVELRYMPDSLLLGLVVSLLAGLAAGVLAFRSLYHASPLTLQYRHAQIVGSAAPEDRRIERPGQEIDRLS